MFSVVPLLGIAVLSLRQRILPNWPAVFYVAGGVLVAAWGCGALSAGRVIDRLRCFFVPGVALGLVCVAVLAAGLPIGARVVTMGDRVISQEMHGWRELAAEVDTLRQMHGGSGTRVVALHRALAAELGFYLPDRPRVYEWPMDIMVYSQYGIWQMDSVPTNGWDAVIVAEAAMNRPPELFRNFESVEPLTEIATRGGSRRFAVYFARSLKAWPRVRYHAPQ